MVKRDLDPIDERVVELSYPAQKATRWLPELDPLVIITGETRKPVFCVKTAAPALFAPFRERCRIGGSPEPDLHLVEIGVDRARLYGGSSKRYKSHANAFLAQR